MRRQLAWSRRITVGNGPIAFGIFIQSKPVPNVFAGPKLHGASVSALAQQNGGLAVAADARGYPSVSALQNAIKGFCGS